MPSPKGRLQATVLLPAANLMVEDLYEYVRVWRENDNTANFNTRIGAASRSVAGRDRQSVQGVSSPEYSVLLAPRNSDIQADDEAWSDTRRYRVLSVDPLPHGMQVLLLNLQ